MKLKVNWEALRGALLEAGKYLVGAILGAGAITLTGCNAMATTPRGQTTEIIACGIPAVAWITHTAQDAQHGGNDDYDVVQSNAVEVTTPLSVGK